MGTAKIMVIFGTRPEAIKMAPVIKELKSREGKGHIECLVCVTAQHRELLDQVLHLFLIRPDFDLNLMLPNQDLFQTTSRVLVEVGRVLSEIKPDLVLVHGDTTTTFGAALAAYYHQISVGHVEAGLRTLNKYSPFPEEMNRHLAGVISDIHFAPTERAKRNLIMENVPSENILVTGNTVIDALLHAVEMINSSKPKLKSYENEFGFLESILSGNKQMVLVTGHRRENFGDGFKNICSAIASLAENRGDIEFVYPVHLNPNVRKDVHRLIGNISNIHLVDPLKYEPFVFLMSRSYIILTDSGGIQEEAPSLRKPVLVMREVTERPEALEAGTVKLVGTDPDRIIAEVNRLLDDTNEYRRMSTACNPYGDGLSSKRIADYIERILQ